MPQNSNSASFPPPQTVTSNPRQLAFLTLRAIDRGAFADVALDKTLTQTPLNPVDRALLTEIVYGCIRRQRTLDAVIDHLAKKKAKQQPPDVRLLLHLGLYQLLYLNHIPASAAVNTTVDLAKHNSFAGLTGFINGLLRQCVREMEQGSSGAAGSSVLSLIPSASLGLLHSFPDWIVQVWLDQFGEAETVQLCEWMNQPPHIDVRVNTLRAEIEMVEAAMQQAEIPVRRVAHLPQALRLMKPSGSVQQLPGFDEGWWIVQDSSAQLVGYLVNPQPGEVVIDACAAPGGKTVHLAELMQDNGTVWACDRTPSRLKKLQQNCDRLGLTSIKLCIGDSRDLPQFKNQADRVLVDAPCSGLGTLHRHADARWRQTPESVHELTILQLEILEQAATWVKEGGCLVYATCTLHPLENEEIIRAFLRHHPDWHIQPPDPSSPPAAFETEAGWVKVLPHRYDMDGFFMARLKKS